MQWVPKMSLKGVANRLDLTITQLVRSLNRFLAHFTDRSFHEAVLEKSQDSFLMNKFRMRPTW